jgi:hypothetical protein
VKLNDVKIERTDGRVRLVGVMERASGERLPDVWFEYPEEYADFVRADADVFAPIMLVTSMLQGEAFETDLSISGTMASELGRVQATLATWFPDTMTARPPKLTTVMDKEPSVSEKTGVFFSAGVDSWYVVLRDRAGEGGRPGRVTHLVYIRGVEAPLSKIGDGKEQQVKSIAERVGLPLVTGRTNLRDVFDYNYLLYVCGPALASTALSLSKGFSCVSIPAGSSYRYDDLYPESSHHLIDPLWSTEYLDIHLDGGDATRPQKIAYIAANPLALENLSICIENNGEYGNCGRCPKCVLTMTTLQSLGLLDKAPTFPSRFDYRLIRTVNLDNPVKRAFLRQNIEFARQRGRDRKLTRALEKHLNRWEKYRALVTLVKDTPLHRPARWLRQFVKDCFVRRR